MGNHARKLLEQFMQMGGGSTILPRGQSVPEWPVRGTEVEWLMCAILRDNRAPGLSVVHAEHGAGKSVATILAREEQQASKCPGIRILLSGDFRQNVEDFFRVPNPQAVDVAEIMFPLLKANGMRLHIVFDTFERGIGTDATSLMGLIRPAFKHGHHIIVVIIVIIITQSKEMAEEVAGLNGERTRIALQQQQEERV